MADPDFAFDREALSWALELMGVQSEGGEGAPSLPAEMPELGLGGRATLDFLAPAVLGKASALGDATAFAHMDPPTPWITWATT